MDTPNSRKLQKHPVPVMGGVAVFFAIVVGLCFYKTMIAYTILFPVLGVMTVMLYLGCLDDSLSIKPTTRLIIEIIAAVALIYGMKYFICNFQGMWGIELLSAPLGIFLSIITFCGIINAINMIDGIDGLSSAFCILIMACFGIYCFIAHYFSFSVLAAVGVGALLPFFLHNVFGYTTKMFIGDGGTLMIGSAIAAMVIVILSAQEPHGEIDLGGNFSRISFTLAVLSMPIADTLRVMFSRMFHRKSPFSPDKDHLHHLFVAVGYSYISITIIEITLNILVICSFILTWYLGGSLELQLYVTIGAAFLFNMLSAYILAKSAKRDDGIHHIVKRIGAHSHVERKGLWLKIQNLIDNKFEIKQMEE
ncbi:MAG: MraY family glycosyltransferase [Prevotellaceae bacterium]|nr:MraY family glycosyltransferase [Prevotellaceae bacterium]